MPCLVYFVWVVTLFQYPKRHCTLLMHSNTKPKLQKPAPSNTNQHLLYTVNHASL